jgi:hypothetical protein
VSLYLLNIKINHIFSINLKLVTGKIPPYFSNCDIFPAIEIVVNAILNVNVLNVNCLTPSLIIITSSIIHKYLLQRKRKKWLHEY